MPAQPPPTMATFFLGTGLYRLIEIEVMVTGVGSVCLGGRVKAH